VLKRWEYFVDDPIFTKLAEDEIINSLSYRLFKLVWNKKRKIVEAV
jgi:hypothetical protein